jgi:hypothetical protein
MNSSAIFQIQADADTLTFSGTCDVDDQYGYDRHALVAKGISTIVSVIYTAVIGVFCYCGATEGFILTFSLVVTRLVPLAPNIMPAWKDVLMQMLLFVEFCETHLNRTGASRIGRVI